MTDHRSLMWSGSRWLSTIAVGAASGSARSRPSTPLPQSSSRLPPLVSTR